MEHTAYFELNFKPNVALVSVVRRFVSEFYARFLSDPDGTSRVALATHELLENAVKYSKDGETTIRIEVEPPASKEPKTVRVILRNRAELANIAAIREIVDGIAKAEDAFAFYQKLIAHKAKTKGDSGLGLARICAEGEMNVTYEVVDGDVTIIRATTSVGERS
jgi:anti-sigma regulatory factor (Ser/Thr protein kinase)